MLESETKSSSSHHHGTTDSPASFNKSSQNFFEASQLRKRKDSEKINSQKSLEKNAVTAKLMQEEISQEGAVRFHSVLQSKLFFISMYSVINWVTHISLLSIIN